MNNLRRDMAFAHKRMERRWKEYGFGGRFFASGKFVFSGVAKQRREVKFITPAEFRLEVVCLHPMRHSDWTVEGVDCLPDQYMGWCAYRLLRPLHFAKGQSIMVPIRIHREPADPRVASLGLFGTGHENAPIEVEADGYER